MSPPDAPNCTLVPIHTGLGVALATATGLGITVISIESTTGLQPGPLVTDTKYFPAVVADAVIDGVVLAVELKPFGPDH